MNNSKSPISLLDSLGLFMGMVGCVHTPSKKCEIRQKVHVARDAQISVDQALQTALEKVQGTEVEAEFEEENHKAIWEVELVTADDTLIEVEIDAKTGKVLDVEEEKAD